MNQLKPYLLRAARDWCLDNGFTPYLLVDATAAGVSVPPGYVEDGKIVLNVNPRAIGHFDLDDAGVRFSARFGGSEFFVNAPLNAVLAIYAKENGQGVSFPPEAGAKTEEPKPQHQDVLPAVPRDAKPPEEPPPGKPPRKGPSLKLVK